jgi:hypothetical protein
MTGRNSRARTKCRRAFAIVLSMSAIGGIGCAGTDKDKQPLGMSSDLQAKLAAPTNKSTAPAPLATFDSASTGGQGVTTRNSFGRLKPMDGTSSPGNFVATLPPPQVGAAPTVNAPAQQGASYATAPMAPDSNRMTTPGRATGSTIQPAGASMMPPAPNGQAIKQEPVATEPPMTRSSLAPVLNTAPTSTPNLSTPMNDPEPQPLPRPVPPTAPAGLGSLPPAAPIMPPAAPPIPQPSALLPPISDGPGGETLAPLPSVTDGPPIHGIKPPAALKPADPVRPF